MPTTAPPAKSAATPRSRVKGRGIDSGAGLSVKERIDRGKALREAVPLASQAEYAAAADRTDPVDILEKQSATRLAELIPERYGRMSESPFRFYRGAAAVMAADLATGPATGLRSQLCGDAHLLNFRLLASPERHLLFDINDFDETLPGPWEWDVKRLAASLVIAGRANGFDLPTRRDIVVRTVQSYREFMRQFAGLGTLDVWHTKADMGELQTVVASYLLKPGRRSLDASLKAAKRRTNLQAVKKLTFETPDGSRLITSDPPLLVPLRELAPDFSGQNTAEGLAALLRRYTRSLSSDRRQLIDQYRIVDMARKVVGVGSVGTRCWIVLLLGRDSDDALLLQVKEAGESVLAPFAGASLHANSGERVVNGQRLMQASSDIFLGWVRADGDDGKSRDFYVRQLRDWKGIMVPEEMAPRGMRTFGMLCGATLARAHAKSGDRVAISAYLGRRDTFDQALATFAEAYADQNERDHARLLDAVATGRVTAAATQAASAGRG